MKKFLASLLILVILAGIAFFCGWAQLGVPPGAYGIIRSKTHGIDPRPVQAGEFRWIWYKLIPTNVEISVFRLEPVNRPFSANGALPSGNTYASFAGADDDFSWQISAVLSFSIRPEALASLLTDNNIGNQEALTHYERTLADQIEAFILRRFGNSAEYSRQIEEMLKQGAWPELEQDILAQFPALTNFSCIIKNARLPDFALYNQLRGLYEDYIAQQRSYISGALDQKAGSRIDTQLRFGELEQYGALLTKYPILLEYLAIEGGVQRQK